MTSAPPPLVRLLSILHAIRWSHHFAHWTARGVPEYGDHLLFERLYEGMDEEIDELGERLVGEWGPEAFDRVGSLVRAGEMLKLFEGTRDPIEHALALELFLRETVERSFAELEAEGRLSLGFNDYLATLTRSHDRFVYFLRSRSNAS